MTLTKEQKEQKRWFAMQDGGKIRTRITKRDINAMHLTESEKWWMEEVAHDLNYPYLCNCFTSAYWFQAHRAPCPDMDSAMRKAVRYFVIKYMKELEVNQTSLRATCEYIADTFRTLSNRVLPILSGLFCNDPNIYAHDRFGLDVIGYRH